MRSPNRRPPLVARPVARRNLDDEVRADRDVGGGRVEPLVARQHRFPESNARRLRYRRPSRRAGALVYQELLERTIPVPSPLMWISGAPTSRQEVTLNLGTRHRFVVPERPL